MAEEKDQIADYCVKMTNDCLNEYSKKSGNLNSEEIQSVGQQVKDGISGYQSYLKDKGIGNSTQAANEYAETVKKQVTKETKDDVAGEVAKQAILAAVQPMEYLVRGAKLKCDCGSHARKLNLQQCHGLHLNELPMVHQKDCKPDIHIKAFGVCRNPLREEEANLNGEDKVLYKTEDDESKNVKGYVCKVKLLAEGEKAEDVELDNWFVGIGKKFFANPFQRLIGTYEKVELAHGSDNPT